MFARFDSLTRHKKGACKVGGVRVGKKRSAADTEEIPKFDGSEFINGQPKPETLARMEKLYAPKTQTIADKVINGMASSPPKIQKLEANVINRTAPPKKPTTKTVVLGGKSNTQGVPQNLSN